MALNQIKHLLTCSSSLGQAELMKERKRRKEDGRNYEGEDTVRNMEGNSWNEHERIIEVLHKFIRIQESLSLFLTEQQSLLFLFVFLPLTRQNFNCTGFCKVCALTIEHDTRCNIEFEKCEINVILNAASHKWYDKQ